MPLGTSQMTVTTAANFIPEQWGPGVVMATEDNLVLWNLTWDWTEDEKALGDIIRFPAVSNFTASAKAANTQVSLSSPTESMTTLTINRHDHAAFLVEDITKALSNFNLSKFYTQKSGFAVSEQLDTRISDLIPSLNQTVGSAGVDLGDADIRNAIEFLDLANAPLTDRHLVIFPTQKTALFGIEKYFRADFRGDGASQILKNGRFGEIYGIPVYISNNLGITTGQRHNVLLHRECFATAKAYGPRTLGSYIHEYLGSLTTVDCVYGEIEVRDDHGVWLIS